MNAYQLIVVGVDGSDGGRRALEWAVREAAERGNAVQAVMVWSWDGLDYGPVTATTREEEQQRASEVLAAQVQEVISRYGSHLPIAAEAIEGRPADVLSAAARNAGLLVLGSHGHSALRHTVLGSVSAECVRKATCPVVVIPVPIQQRAPVREPVPRH
ncbi:universal stress protein [Actinoplanes sp. GCM10030250]|uniref:universal stress protein n=1 Tax=Actinoplanes sp. GCM10030250 TaxID=3273376 RepID=UPI003621F337